MRNVRIEAKGQSDARKGLQTKECEKSLESEKDKEMDFSLKSLKGTQHYHPPQF